MDDEIEQNRPDLLKEFGTAVRKIRTERGLSQEQFADLCGLDRTYVGGVERGERNVGLVNVHRIADALNLLVSDLFRASEATKQ